MIPMACVRGRYPVSAELGTKTLQDKESAFSSVIVYYLERVTLFMSMIREVRFTAYGAQVDSRQRSSILLFLKKELLKVLFSFNFY